MSKLHSTFVFAVLLIISVPAFSADFKEARDAIERKEYTLALRQLTPLAEQGDARAQYYLGWLYQYAKGVEKDSRTATKWYRAAADQGYAEAQYEMGQAYIWGEERGVREDPAKAAAWFLKAAKQGNQQAQASLGEIYSGGGVDLWLSAKGPIKYGNVSADFPKAAKWYRTAIDQGYSTIHSANLLGNATYQLAMMYMAGKGVSRDPVQAYKWFSIAADWYEEFRIPHFSIRWRDDLKKTLTAAQLAEGEKLANTWRAQHKKP
jgi:TPR repeat protein